MSKSAQPLLHGGGPPPYGTSNNNQHYIHHGVNYVPHAQPVVLPGTTVVVIRDRSGCCGRFCKTLIFTILIWVCLVTFLKGLILLAALGFNGRPHQWALGPATQSPAYPIPPEIYLKTCEEPLRNGGSGQTSFEISSLSDTVLLLSAGSWLYGSVRVTTTSAETDSVKVSVALSTNWYRQADVIVCALERKDGEHGVGVFNPISPRGYRNRVQYDVVVEFPEKHPLVKHFEARTVNAAQQIDDLQGKITFNDLILHTRNGAILAQSISTGSADIHTSNGPIEGYFNASDNLFMMTSNGRIEADIDFSQKGSARAGLSMKTTNGPITAKLKLHDLTASKNDKSNFQVTTTTSNARLNVAFQDAPVGSVLDYQGITSNGRAELSLHPTFEGHLTLSSGSRWLIPEINDQHPDDPSGQGRSRVLKLNHEVLGISEGDVHWGTKSHEGQGSASVRTSNAKITLNL